MPIVKAQQAMRTRQSAIVMDLSDLEHQAANLVADARAQGQQIVAQARARAEAEAQEIRNAARAAGHQEGFAAGMEEGNKQGHAEAVAATTQQVTDLVSRWGQTLDTFQQHFPTHLAETKTDVVRLAVAIAAKVIHQQARRDHTVARANVEAALALVAAGRTVTLTLHPDEIALAEAYLPEMIAKLGTALQVNLAADEAVAPGGCVVRFGAGEVDASLDTQIQRISAELLAGQE